LIPPLNVRAGFDFEADVIFWLAYSGEEINEAMQKDPLLACMTLEA